MPDYQHMPIWRLRDRARRSDESSDQEAARVFVDRILDMEVERRTLIDHVNLGWHTVNPLATIGESHEGTAKVREPLATLYDRGIFTHEQHQEASRWIEAAGLPPRQLLAVLIQARKLHPRQQGNEWTKSYDYIASNVDRYAKSLGLMVVPGRRARMVIRERVPQHRNSQHIWPVPESCQAAEMDRVARASHPRSVEYEISETVPVFKNGKAIRDAAQAARAQLILWARQ